MDALVERAGQRPTDRSRRAAWGMALTALAGLLLATAPVRADWAWPETTTVLSAGDEHSSVADVDPAIPDGRDPVDVIVQARPGVAWTDLQEWVQQAEGRVTKTLPIVDGVAAELPGDRVAALAAHDGIVAITLDRTATFETITYDEEGTASAFVPSTGASALWDQGYLGEGVGIAVLDTGISEMADFEGRLVHGPDLSGDGTVIDRYGHGTVMAGIIGGSGLDSADNGAGAYTGVAPAATLVSVKVSGANGAADVSTLLQAMHWVSAYADQFDIRVLNLSWGTPSTQDPAVDPLNYAVQRLWGDGIVVVVAAGNDGPASGTISKPADDPMVLTVGAYDDKGTARDSDDTLVSWSSQGPTADGLSKPDLVAPGRRLIATRSYGSTVATEHTKALVDPSYIRGSGSSQAAAVTSGVVALLLDARPELTPDQVKYLLTSTADPVKGDRPNEEGAGRVDLDEALVADPGDSVWQQPTSSGLGSIEASRGGWNVETDCDGDGTAEPIVGEIDVRCEEWQGSAWTGSAWTGSAWTGSAWTGSAWTGSAWTGSAWTGSAWTGSAWTGGTWTGSAWTGSAWTGSAWTGSAWTGSAWTGSAWTGSAWTGSAWTGSAWTTGAYEPEEDLWATAWWGMSPPPWRHIPGEGPPVDAIPRR